MKITGKAFNPRNRVRNLLGWYMAVNGLGRIAATWLAPGCCVMGIPGWIYGLLFAAVGTALLATTHRRVALGGRLLAAIASGLLTYIAIDAWPVMHHALTYGLFAVVMVIEAWRPRV